MNVKLRIKNIVITALLMSAIVAVIASTMAYCSYISGYGGSIETTTLIVIVMLIGTFKFMFSEPVRSINHDLGLLNDAQYNEKLMLEAHSMATTLASMFINIVAILAGSAILKLF